MAETLIETVVWDGGELALRELATLWRTDAGWALRGSLVGVLEGVPFSARYHVACNASWETRRAQVELLTPPEVHETVLEVDGGRRWTVDGRERPDLRGLVDVDVQLTPATNTLPIRRLALAVGEEAGVEAVWVRFPRLEVSRLPQRYRRTGERSYLYASRDFRADLEVDEHGVVRRYGSFWRTLDG
jgi:hypothetical protein